jgi:hypothetical protein
LKHATVKDLALEVDIKGKAAVGGLTGAAYAETTIERVSVTGTIEGNEHVGGITGRISTDPTYPGYNQITDCYVNAQVSARINAAGGMIGIGRHKVKIKNAYVAGKVEAKTDILEGNAGGIVSANEVPYIQAEGIAVVTDGILGGTPAYFFCRQNAFESFLNLYARNDMPALSYFNTADKGTGFTMVTAGMLLNPVAFLSRDFYETTLGWDFTNVWSMVPEEKYPVLKAQQKTSVIRQETLWDYQVHSTPGGIVFSAAEPVSLTVFNMLAQTMYAGKNVGIETYIPLPQGIYIIKVEKDKHIVSTKVIVK